MTEVVPASEANRRFSALLRRARQGETIGISTHGETVAYLVPRSAVPDQESARRTAVLQDIIAAARARPVQNIGPWTRDELYDD